MLSDNFKFTLIIIFQIISALCENTLLVLTYNVLAIIQNKNFDVNNQEINFGEKFINFIDYIGFDISLILFLKLLLLIAFIQALVRYLESINVAYICAWVGERINKDIAKIILYGNYEKINSLRTGKLLNISLTCPDALTYQIKIISDTIVCLFYIFVYSQILITLSLKEFIVSSATLSIVAFVQLLTQKKVKSRSSETNSSKSSVGNIISEMIKSIKYVKSSGSMKLISKKLNFSTKDMKSKYVKERMLTDIVNPLSIFITVSILVFIIYIFTNSVNESNLLLPTVGIFIVSIQRLAGKVADLGKLNTLFNQNSGKLEIYNELVENYNNSSEEQSRSEIKEFSLINNDKYIENIDFKNIYYKYPDKKKWILEDINFEAKIGDIVGFVGKSGTGKSTILNIISGLLLPKRGYYLINKKENINNYDFSENYVAYVSQDAYLIPGTIFENIVWDQKPNLKKAINCMKMIDSINLLNSLKDGYKTVVGEGGKKLSSGQTQLICIARAIYKNSSILILDEATNALDASTEKNTFKVLKKLAKNKIIFIVSHNLENIKLCNKIFLLKNCLLKRQQSYSQLLKNYQDLDFS